MNRIIKFRLFGKNSKEFLQDKNGYGLTMKEIQNVECLDDWEMSQFTGLIDKNGKEIWEGDIVTGEAMESGYLPTAVVKYCSPEFLAVDNGIIRITLNNTCEVVGNIYENSDLIKPIKID